MDVPGARLDAELAGTGLRHLFAYARTAALPTVLSADDGRRALQLLPQLQMQPAPTACPQCKREVAETDKFCAYCGQDLEPGKTSDMRELPSVPG